MHLKLWDFNTLVLLEPFLIRLGPFLPNFLVCLIHGRLRNQSCSDLKYSKVKLLDANCWKIYTIRDRIGTFIIPIGKSFVDSCHFITEPVLEHLSESPEMRSGPWNACDKQTVKYQNSLILKYFVILIEGDFSFWIFLGISAKSVSHWEVLNIVWAYFLHFETNTIWLTSRSSKQFIRK